MNESTKNFLAWLLVFVPIIAISWSIEIIKKCYYVCFRIPHRKIDDKFHTSYGKIDE